MSLKQFTEQVKKEKKCIGKLQLKFTLMTKVKAPKYESCLTFGACQKKTGIY